MQSSRPETLKEFRASNSKMRKDSAVRDECVRQVEYYLSDSNLQSDTFYRPKISSSVGKQGWFQLRHIMTAPRIKEKSITIKDLAVALMRGSKSVEIKQENDGTYFIRRKGGKQLPPFRSKNSRGRYRRSRYADDNDDYSSSAYGFDGGCMGYSARDCDHLLECGVKPWDDDAGMVLSALNGYD